MSGFNEEAHPREPAGSPEGGQFTSGGDSTGLVEKHGLQELHAHVAHVPIEHAAADDPEMSGSTAGYYDSNSQRIRVLEGSDKLVVTHELAHAIDNKLGGGGPDDWFTNDTRWSAVLREDQKSMDAWTRRDVGRTTYWGDRKEAFAEVLTHVLHGEGGAAIGRAKMEKAFPRSIAFVRQHIATLGIGTRRG